MGHRLRPLGHLTHHGQDGAFPGRFGSGIVGEGGAHLQGVSQRSGIHHLGLTQGNAKATPDLGQDHAGIATRAVHRAFGKAPRQRANVGFIQLGDLRVGALHGQQHVDSGIAIGHGEDVELVHNLVVLLQPGHAGQEQLLELAAIQSETHVLR